MKFFFWHKGPHGLKEIYGLGMLQAYYEWCMETTEAKAEQLIKTRRFLLEDRTEMKISRTTVKEIKIHIQWLPFNLKGKILKDFFEQFGEVLEIIEEICPEPQFSHVKNGVLQLVVHLKDSKSMNDIPHVAQIGKFPAMITIAGRKPTCLKCGDPTHIFKNCPKRGKNKATFSEVIQENRPMEKFYKMQHLSCRNSVTKVNHVLKVPILCR